MVDTVIQLGSFVFQGMEIPEKINFGGEQQLAQHNLIGGNRVIDLLGKNDFDISWSGLMQGPNALSRAQQLNQYRTNGQQLNLQWFNLNYTVLIVRFVANTERYYQVSYELVLRVISDNNTPVTSQNLVGFNEAITNDFNTANTLASNINNTSINSAMANLNAAIVAVPSFNGASQTQLTSVQAELNSTIQAVQSAIAQPAQNLFGQNT